MKKLFIILVSSFGLMSCTENQMAKNFGGKETITLEKGARLVNITWKSTGTGGSTASSLWILTKKDTATAPTTYSFKEKSDFGIMEGEVIIIEK